MGLPKQPVDEKRQTVQIARFDEIDLETVYSDLGSSAQAEGRPYTIVNMVSSVDGKSTVAGRAGKLGTAVDHLVMRKIRAAGDALLYGAGTLRAERVDPRVPAEIARRRAANGLREQPLRVVVSATGLLPVENPFFKLPGEPVIIFVAAVAGDAAIAKLQAHARVFVAGSLTVDLRRAMALLAGELGVRTLIAEGGPELTYGLFRDGLVDELLLTLAPKVVGGEGAKTIAEGPELDQSAMPALELCSVHRHESELFLRYRVARDASTALG